MPLAHSFAPVADKNAKVLILGSMPGEISLSAGEYYATPRNVFWRIMAKLFRFDAASPYELRIRALKSVRIALWDVLHSCAREGSSDAEIDNDSLTANDFKSFLRGHPKIQHVFFNGAKAEACYRRHVLPQLHCNSVIYLRLPSTSPANASMSYKRKLKAWRVITAQPQLAAARNRRSLFKVDHCPAPDFIALILG
jgi:hypoxanthine-DNA glycosylase